MMSQAEITIDPQAIQYETLDLHTEGEPLRLITSGFPQAEGATVVQRRLWAMENLDEHRRALMLEPRGHADMYGAILTPPDSADADAGVLFVHNEGFSTMCGHGVIAVASAIVRQNLLALENPGVVRLDTPAGRVVARVHEATPWVVQFLNVPSFVEQRAVPVSVDGLDLTADIAFGGAYYAFVDATQCGLSLEPEEFGRIVALGKQIKAAVRNRITLAHPSRQAELNFLYGVIFHGPGKPGAHSRHVCVFADGEVDRSPTGTGVSARAALLAESGDLDLGQEALIESLIGGQFSVRVAARRRLGQREVVIPEVRGRTYMVGSCRWVVEPDDPMRSGFLLR